MKGILIKQYLNGEWVNLIEIPQAGSAMDITQEDIDAALKQMYDLIYEGEKIKVYCENDSVIFNRMDGPVKVSWGDIKNENVDASS